MNLPNGWLKEREAIYLAHLVNSVAELEGSFLEVGSFYGRATVAIGTEVKKLNSQLYCIDIWNEKMTGKDEIERERILDTYRAKRGGRDIYSRGDPYLIFTENIKAWKLDDTVIPMIGFSSTVMNTWRTPLRFIFIDGNHEYKYVQMDCLWRHFLVDSGIIAFHDYRGGIKKAINKEMGNDPNFHVIGGARSIIAFGKK